MGGGYETDIPVLQINRLRLQGVDLNLGLRTSRSCHLHLSFGHQKEGVLLDSSLEFQLLPPRAPLPPTPTEGHLPHQLVTEGLSGNFIIFSAPAKGIDPPGSLKGGVARETYTLVPYRPGLKASSVTFWLDRMTPYRPILGFWVGKMEMLMWSRH